MTETSIPAAPKTEAELAAEREARRQQRTMMITIVVGVVVFIALIVLAVIYLLQDTAPTDKIRDIFIIFMALESLLIGIALIVLIAQIASLINLLQNEIRPILEATNETVNTLRGTTQFLSQNLIDPVIKLQGYLAGLNRLLDMLGIKRK
jgi:hypothetical protein